MCDDEYDCRSQLLSRRWNRLFGQPQRLWLSPSTSLPGEDMLTSLWCLIMICVKFSRIRRSPQCDRSNRWQNLWSLTGTSRSLQLQRSMVVGGDGVGVEEEEKVVVVMVVMVVVMVVVMMVMVEENANTTFTSGSEGWGTSKNPRWRSIWMIHWMLLNRSYSFWVNNF